MKLEFQLLIVDDNPAAITNATDLLADYLATKGFALKRHVAPDLSESALRQLARREGQEYDLVAVDYNLGRPDTTGAIAVARLRRELRYTDMVFYSSDPSVNLFQELAAQEVAGVFIAQRQVLDEALKGLADTIIGKAIDLNHMRGIAMAEVAEMDVLMEEVLARAFECDNAELAEKGKETLAKLLASAEEHLGKLKELIDSGEVVQVVTDGRLFSSAHRYMAINRITKCLPTKPIDAVGTLKSYDPDIIQNRNTLAHAKEEVGEDGSVTLRAIKRGKPPVIINDEWMVQFRSKLREHRNALDTVCAALNGHVDACVEKPK